MVRKRSPVRVRPRAYFLILDLKASSQKIKKAVEILRKGGVIAIPTDTVFGFVCPYWSKEGIERIFKIKKREKTKTLGIFISDKKEVNKFARKITETRKRLIYNLWPGPLTLLFEAKRNIPPYLIHPKKNTVSLRIPSHPVPLRLCREAGPLVQTSVNISGEKEIFKYKEVIKKFGNMVDYVYPQDASYSVPSTILDVSKTPFVMVRKGPVGIAKIENVLLKKIKISSDIKTNILFVCTGNTCRSPLAMGIFYKLLPENLKDKINIKSAGLRTTEGFPISDKTLTVLKENYNVNLNYLKTHILKKEHLEWADFIYVMEKTHLREIQKMGYYEKTKLLCSNKRLIEVPDPFGKDLLTYRNVAKLIERCIKKIIKEIEYRYSK